MSKDKDMYRRVLDNAKKKRDAKGKAQGLGAYDKGVTDTVDKVMASKPKVSMPSAAKRKAAARKAAAKAMASARSKANPNAAMAGKLVGLSAASLGLGAYDKGVTDTADKVMRRKKK